ncbi:lytic transglycosylase domain-containing protein [Lentibacillus cibarius]|uniref:Lytic transglycosylase domain-containing protein n=1 Tax=Lentibacillus cibarius TaxID=2583219 RepID=A0A549YA85_9BACI|nr:lytic transglycosylase domain-containing protein [Lentibacillus cibarius]TRM08782.1 lytic transglycosylase domain-containing protein [Lentibacillus cibarius]
MNIYKDAAAQYNIDWELIAAVHKVETNYSTHPTMISSAGAIGHMQFMPATWDHYGVDANGDKEADPWNLQDAIHSAAYYLSETGAADGEIIDALWAYNHSTEYGQNVLSIAENIRRNNDV